MNWQKRFACFLAEETAPFTQHQDHSEKEKLMKNRFSVDALVILKTAAVSLWLFHPNIVYAQGTPADQYKQMGSLGALTEICYGSKLLPQAVNNSLRQYAAQGPTQTEIAKGLFASYNEAYANAAQNRKIWNGTQQTYGPKTFDCALPADVEMLKKFEQMFLQNLK